MQNSNIEWTTHTFNPWEGCTKVSPGCLHCYAETRNKRWAGGKNWGKGAPRRRTSVSNWKEPLKWNAEAAHFFYGGERPEREMAAFGWRRNRPRVFCASLADWLDDEVEIDWLIDLLILIHSCPNLDWLMLTKRPENWKSRLASAMNILSGTRPATDANAAVLYWLQDWLNGKGVPKNVWIGTTVEDQLRAEQRLPVLTAIPAARRFLSVEPQLEDVKLRLLSRLGPVVRVNETFSKEECLIDWVICGGESGPGARPFFADWACELLYECKAAGVPFFMKQFGAHVRTENANVFDWPDHVTFNDDKAGHGAAACRIGFIDSRKGGDIDEFPFELRVREFPASVS